MLDVAFLCSTFDTTLFPKDMHLSCIWNPKCRPVELTLEKNSMARRELEPRAPSERCVASPSARHSSSGRRWYSLSSYRLRRLAAPRTEVDAASEVATSHLVVRRRKKLSLKNKKNPNQFSDAVILRYVLCSYIAMCYACVILLRLGLRLACSLSLRNTAGRMTCLQLHLELN